MKKYFRSILAAVLAVIMIFGAVPFVGNAMTAMKYSNDGYNKYSTNAIYHSDIKSMGGVELPPISQCKFQDIKVMSYNIYVENKKVNGYDCTYKKRMKYIAQTINDVMPDSFGLQEATSKMRNLLETTEDLNGKLVGDNYSGVGDYRGSKDYKGKTINSESSPVYYNKNKFTLEKSGTFWLSESGEKNSIHSKAKYPRVCTYALLKNKETGLEYLHVNTHMEHDLTKDKEIKSNEAAIFSSEKIIDFINKNFPDVPVVVTGDFNQKKGSEPYNVFINEGYTDTRDIYKGSLNTYTNCFNQSGDDGKLYEAKVIDHILVNDSFWGGINSYKVYNEDYSFFDKYGYVALDYPYPSDHHPVVVELTATYVKSSSKDGYYSVMCDDYNSSLSYDNGVFTAKMTDPNLKERYTVNMPSTPESRCEYSWEISFTDGENLYNVTTIYFAGGMFGYPQNYSASLYEMQNSVFVWDKEPDENGVRHGHFIADASLTVDEKTLTWTFTLPDEYDFDAENMSITNATIYDINSDDEGKDFAEVIKDIFETIVEFILTPIKFLIGLFT
ncbi:MAG: endonuclease/exonuclease/phosphatase family protein [Clostridia bacterium]|nr:endonuclease/exonuclease/phosphatase family protein [Clostridia bacterium]